MLRKVLAVMLGLLACQVVFGALAVATMVAWPDYAVHGRHWLRGKLFTFPSGIACLNLVFWGLSFVAAGWTAGRIARAREVVWVLAGVMESYAAWVHVVRSWSSFPWWYNLVLVAAVVPAVWCGSLTSGDGSKLARRSD